MRGSLKNQVLTPDKVGTIGMLLMGPDGALITGSDFLMDGGVTPRLRVRRTRPQITEHRPLRGTQSSPIRSRGQTIPERIDRARDQPRRSLNDARRGLACVFSVS